jgi:hypothetical protein
VVKRLQLQFTSSLLTLIFTLTVFTIGSAQTYSKSFTVPQESSDLEIISQTGSVRISSTAGANKIVINARQSESEVKIDASQSSSGKVKVEVKGKSPVDFEISAPSAVNLDILCYKCVISISNTSGSVIARNTDGQIQFAGLRSPRVEAHSAKGGVQFQGEILPSGNYTLKSFSGRVEATLPATGDFNLVASSYRGGMDLGGLPLKFEKQSDQLVKGAMGSGKATISLWTQDGSIQLHRKP